MGGARPRNCPRPPRLRPSRQHPPAATAHRPLRQGWGRPRADEGGRRQHPRPSPHREQRNPAVPASPLTAPEPRLHPPAASRSGDHRRPRATAGASEPVSGGRGPAASALPADLHRTLPPAPAAAAASQPALHPAPRRPPSSWGAAPTPRAQSPAGTAASTAEAGADPVFLF
ncbi:translation initiation factor IF-2-like [Neovison vison]|uniref:translation initiation factor IF-2-like n=1 Tax=Neovison vison TaxID=452646 RepID=UPI001CF0BE44|nr:translation initiation factor IF-2-like [Neogale vison]